MQCSFGMDGRIYEESDYIRVTMSGDMITIEFITNSVLPLKISYLFNNVYRLSIGGNVVFRKVLTTDRVTVSVQDSLLCGDIMFSITVGTSVKYGSIAAGNNIWLQGDNFFGVEVAEWAVKHGVCYPIGCDFSVSALMYKELGCKVELQCNFADVELAYGVHLPIFLGKEGVFVFNELIPVVDSDNAMVFIRVNSIEEGVVHFNLAVWQPGNLRVFKDVEYSEIGCSYGDSFVKKSVLTKQLLLGSRGVEEDG